MICDGPACPDLTAFVAEVRVTGEADMGARLLDPLLAAFAATRGLRLAGDRVTGRSELAGARLGPRGGAVPFIGLPCAGAAAEALRLGDADHGARLA